MYLKRFKRVFSLAAMSNVWQFILFHTTEEPIFGGCLSPCPWCAIFANCQSQFHEGPSQRGMKYSKHIQRTGLLINMLLTYQYQGITAHQICYIYLRTCLHQDNKGLSEGGRGWRQLKGSVGACRDTDRSVLRVVQSWFISSNFVLYLFIVQLLVLTPPHPSPPFLNILCKAKGKSA